MNFQEKNQTVQTCFEILNPLRNLQAAGSSFTTTLGMLDFAHTTAQKLWTVNRDGLRMVVLQWLQVAACRTGSFAQVSQATLCGHWAMDMI